ncbi:MAG: CoA pyrophosphatase [Rhizobiaceae bacterium]|nr:CoA pyrophosphatase [Rhizobiaceae bacterium]
MESTALSPYSAADFRWRAARETGPFRSDDHGDHLWSPEIAELIGARPLREAAVLVPVVDHPHEATVLLTKRTERLRSHSGQVAFPGGRIDPVDATPEDAALRETLEEIGLPRSQIEIVGRMPDYLTGSAYRIAPVLGVVRPGFTLSVNHDEVDDVFEVPLRFLMDPGNHHRHSAIWQEKERFYYDMSFEPQRRIWGVTAGILRMLYNRLYK